ncbi:protein PHLOEM PROTEIN 2-LIKE A9 [Populus alba]|uniref:Lectin family protein n=1 Tax=Populus alba TaxID=43335 RepID=A0A4U5PV66_POPAL|nr:protein PHLOEM PROTEIN 2-LIKE A9-like [Populus alba]TKS01363.1 lectin family protein [Populus alba]
MSSSNKPHYEADSNKVFYEEDKNSWTFKPRGFSIIWGNDKRYWNLPDQTSSDEIPAELVQVCWLELTGTTKDPLKEGKYKIKFEVSMKSDAFGWSGCPVFMMAKLGKKGRYRWSKVDLSDVSKDKKSVTSDFVIDVSKETDDTKLYFGLYEVWTGKWKGGLLIHQAIVEKVP